MNGRTLGRLTTATGGAIMAAGIGLAIAVGGTAQATTYESGMIDLNPDHVGASADDFQQECDGPLADVAEGEDGWHFVLPSSFGDDFEQLDLTFSKADGSTVDVTITSTDETSPSTGPGWEGFIDNAGTMDKHAYLITEAGWTLTGGTATVSGASEGGFFNLSHTCPGGVPESPSPSPSESESPSPSPSESESPSPRPSESESPSPSEKPSPPPSESPAPTPTDTMSPAPSAPETTPAAAPPSGKKPTLPVTGIGISSLLLLGGGLLVAGIAMMAVQGRRDLVKLLENS